MNEALTESERARIPSLDAVRNAAKAFVGQKDDRGGPAIVETPTLYSRVLSDHFERVLQERSSVNDTDPDIQIYVKHENMQVTAAYKERGALNKLLALKDSGVKGVVAASAGNHAQGVACHARRLGLSATIFMPPSTPTLKVMRTRQHGAKVELEGEGFEECRQAAEAHARAAGLAFIDPFDDPEIIAGQGTVALEMLDREPGLQTLVVPIGGGGLISGMAIAAKAIKPDIKVIGVEAELFPTLYNARHGVTARIVGGDTIAEGIAVRRPGRFTNHIVNGTGPNGAGGLVDEILLVSEMWIEEAIGRLIELEKTVVEGAGAAGLAALLQHAHNPLVAEHFRGKKVGIVLTGGNIDTRLLANILVRDLLIENRMARISIVLKDQPRELMKALEILGGENINIVEIAQDRLFHRLPAKNVAAQIDCEAGDPGAFARAILKLEEAGFQADWIPSHEFQRELPAPGPAVAPR